MKRVKQIFACVAGDLTDRAGQLREQIRRSADDDLRRWHGTLEASRTMMGSAR